jgi:hypothetical protein
MVEDVFAIGFSVDRLDLHLLRTEAGLKMIPPPLKEESYSPADRYRGVFVALDKTNLVALRMMGGAQRARCQWNFEKTGRSEQKTDLNVEPQ